MPSSVMLGSRPRICWMRAYSSGVTPCSAAISGVTRISVLAVAMFAPSCAGRSNAAPLQNKFPGPGSSSCGLCGTDERFDHGTQNDQAVGRAESGFRGALGMGHEAGDVAFAVADARDIVNCAVGIAGVVSFLGSRKATDRTVGRGVAEDHLLIFLEFGERGFVAGVIAIVVRNGNLQDLALLRGVREGRVRLLDTDVDVTADVAEAAIAHHRAGEQARFAKNLEAVADTQDHAAALGELLDGLHHR